MSRLCNGSGTLTWAFAALTVALVGCSSGTNNKGQTHNVTCESGDTRECVGPGACRGAQSCQSDSSWSICDCGATSGTGGAGGNGNTSATTSLATGIGGSSSSGGATGLSTGGSIAASTTTDIGGSNSSGGATGLSTGGSIATATGGAAPGETGGAPQATGGAGPGATGGAPQGTGGAVAATGGAPQSTGGVSSVVGATGGATSVSVGGTATVGGSSTASTTSPYLVSVEGWITDSAHKIDGPLYTYADDGGSRITPDCVTDDCFEAQGTTTSFCVNGKVAKALDEYGDDCEMTSSTCDWQTYWGASMAFSPNQGSGTEPLPWDASAYTGISFKVTVDTMPPSLRIYLKLTDETQFCYELGSSAKSYTVNWSQFYTNCYTTGGVKPTAADLKNVESIVWQAGANASAAGNFDFCVSDMKIVP